MMTRPLEGVKVIDLTVYAAGPAAGRILADWGADVIKVEPPKGEPGRFSGALLGMPNSEEENPSYEFLNANKKSIVLNLKDPKGLEIMDKLLSQADVFVTSNRTQALERLGLDYETMSKKHPHIVWGQVNGYGDLGPAAENAGFDTVAFWARTGAMMDFADAEANLPNTSIIAFGDNTSACSLAAGICAALYRKQKTGKGDKVMVSLYGQALFNSGLVVASTQYGDVYPKTRKEVGSPLVNSYRCKDGEWVFLSAIDFNRYYEPICKLIHREDLIGDEKFNSVKAARKNSRELVDILDEGFLKYTQDEWVLLLQKADIAHDRILHFKDAHKDEQALANGYVYPYKNANGNITYMSATPVKFNKIESPEHRPSPLLGEHTKLIMKEIGYSDEEIEQYIREKVIVSK